MRGRRLCHCDDHAGRTGQVCTDNGVAAAPGLILHSALGYMPSVACDAKPTVKEPIGLSEITRPLHFKYL